MVETRLGTGADGRPVVVKAAGAERIGREAAVLAAARHPGVVEVASASPSELELRWIGGRTLANLRPPIDEAAAIGAALAATVADLHAIGVRHGGIRPEHVVLDGDGRPVLCGFGAAGRRGEPDAPAEADDVAGLGDVLRSLVGPETELEPIPDHRFARRRAWAGATRRALLTLADQASADDPAHRPTARAFAAAIAACAPAAVANAAVVSEVVPLRPDRRTIGPPVAPPSETPNGRPVPWRLVAGAVGLGLLAAGVSSIVGSPSAPQPATAGEALSVVECPPVEEPAVDHDGDGCPSTLTIDGGVVVVDDVRYAVGAPGDAIAVGDWDCDGVATVVAVRPSSGEVYLFDEWATPAAELVVVPTTTVPGAVRAEAAGTGCGLAVVDRAGNRTEVTS